MLAVKADRRFEFILKKNPEQITVMVRLSTSLSVTHLEASSFTEEKSKGSPDRFQSFSRRPRMCARIELHASLREPNRSFRPFEAFPPLYSGVNAAGSILQIPVLAYVMLSQTDRRTFPYSPADSNGRVKHVLRPNPFPPVGL